MVKDHKGNVYKSLIEMCRAWHMPYELVYQRIKVAKWPVFEALETPQEDGMHIFDQDGTEYDSFAEMCAEWNITQAAYRGRRLRGWTREDALTTELIKPGTVAKDKERILSLFDQLSGMTAEDLLEAVEIYRQVKEQERDVKAAHFENRPRMKTGPATKAYTDREGNYFSCLREACNAYGQSYNLCKHRLFDGWPFQFAVEYPAGSASFTDHVGNEFTSLSSMCKYYDIDKRVFAKRYDEGWSLKDALTLPEEETPKFTKDEKKSL